MACNEISDEDWRKMADDAVETSPRVKTITIEPDGLLSAAYNVVEELVAAGMVKPSSSTCDFTEGEFMIAIFQALTRNMGLIKKSSWIPNNNRLEKADIVVRLLMADKTRTTGTIADVMGRTYLAAYPDEM